MRYRTRHFAIAAVAVAALAAIGSVMNAQPPGPGGPGRPGRGMRGGPGGPGGPAAYSAPTIPKTEAEKKILPVLDDMNRNQRAGMMNVPEADGQLLRLLVESLGAKTVVEIGMSNGYSGLWMALGLRSTGGKLITHEIDEGRAKLARENFKRAGVEDIVIDPGASGPGALPQAATQLRRLAIKKNVRALGYPLLAWCGADTLEDEVARATAAIAKYAGIVVVDRLDPALLYPLVTWRQNLYTDPQKPIQVEPRLYEIGGPDADSPLLITTNFSLTYFTVSGEVEGSGVPAWLLVADADGQSVLTGWAAGKFDAEKVAKTVKDAGVDGRLNHTKLVIPGHVATLSGEIEEELPGWQILVGPREAADLPSYLKNVWAAQ